MQLDTQLRQDETMRLCILVLRLYEKMKMWLKHATLVLLTVAGAAVVTSSQTTVELGNSKTSSTLTKLELSPGSSLTFKCSLSTDNSIRYRVLWYFIRSGSNQTEIMCNTMVNKSPSNSTEQPKQDVKERCHNEILKLSDINETNSGWYYCKVKSEIPLLQTNMSDRKEIIVNSKSLVGSTTYLSLVTSKQATTHSYNNRLLVDWWLWVVVGVSSLILISLLVICVVQNRRGSSDREEPIYVNHRRSLPQDDKLKTSPSNPNLRAPSPAMRYDEGQRRSHC